MAANGTSTETIKQQRTRFSLPVDFISKMGRKLSVGSSSVSGSLNNLSNQYETDSQLPTGASNNERPGRSRSRKTTVVSSEEELNRQFADFDTYFNGCDPAPVPIIFLQSADDDDQPVNRQRSRSETRPPSHFSRFLKFNRRRPSQTENCPSSTCVTQSLELPVSYERRASFQALSTPVSKSSLEQLPEGVQVHHATPTSSRSPEHFNGPSPFLFVPIQSDKLRFDKATFRDRSSTFASTDGLNRRNLSDISHGPIQRERSVSLSVTQAGKGKPTPAGSTKKRRSLSSLFWPPPALFGRSR